MFEKLCIAEAGEHVFRCTIIDGAAHHNVRHSKGEAMKLHLVLAVLLISASAFAAEEPVNVPADENAQYFVLEKSGSDAERIIVTKRVGPRGTTYSKRLYNCTESTVKYLGTGDSLEEMAASEADLNMEPIAPGTIGYYVGVEACK